MAAPRVSKAEFMRFCDSLVINTKEMGQTVLGKRMLGTQRYFVDRVFAGLEEDRHTFVVLKGRQLGITTVSLALDLYWLFKHPGLAGTMIMHEESARDQFRTTLQQYYDGLPRGFRRALTQHNRNQMVFKNQSALFYQMAGTRSGGKLGRGKSIIFCHGTEVTSWGLNEEGFASLDASFAQQNPDRLFIFESTARGFDMFHDMYGTAKDSISQEAIFIPWWMNELYACGEQTPIYKTYWDGKLDAAEREWVKDVKRLYKYDMTPGQMAWWRWRNAETAYGTDYMLQEYPPTENYAFMMSGSEFFGVSRLTEAHHAAKKKRRDCQYFRMQFGLNFKDTKMVPCGREVANLRIWEEPIKNAVQSKAYYVIGADPAYGSSDWADNFCLQVFRCYADGIEQVAEFTTSAVTAAQFAWALCYLAGAYDNTIINLEVTGPGSAVLAEMDTMKKMAAAGSAESGDRKFLDVVRNIQSYTFKRYQGGSDSGNIRHWYTTASTKPRMMYMFKDSFQRGMIDLASEEIIDEMKEIRQDGNVIEAPGRRKDDRVVAAALAHVAWQDNLRPRLAALRVLRQHKAVLADGSAAPVAQQRHVSGYLSSIGYK